MSSYDPWASITAVSYTHLNTDNIASNIINTPADDNTVAGANIPLSAVTMNEVG